MLLAFSVKRLCASIYVICMLAGSSVWAGRAAADSLDSHLSNGKALVESITPENNSYNITTGSAVLILDPPYALVSCSTFLTLLLESSYQIDSGDVKLLLGEEWPEAEDYHEAIVGSKTFREVADFRNVQPGDIIAIKYRLKTDQEQTNATGHVMIAASSVRLADDSYTSPYPNATAYVLDVLDATESAHGTTDTRITNNPDCVQNTQTCSDQDGVGIGTMRLFLDRYTGAVRGYAWSTMSYSNIYPQHNRHMVAGRLIANAIENVQNNVQ